MERAKALNADAKVASDVMKINDILTKYVRKQNQFKNSMLNNTFHCYVHGCLG